MAIDPSIALGVKPLEVANPLAQYGQIAQLQAAQNQNALAQYQLSAAQRADEQQNKLYSAAQQPNFKLDFQSAIQYGAPGIAAFKAQQEAANAALTQTKTQAEIEEKQLKNRNDKLNFAYNSVGSAPTPEAAAQKIKEGLKDGFLDFNTASAELKQIQDLRTPEDFQQYRLKKLMGILKEKDKVEFMLPKIKQLEAGGSVLGIQDNPMLPGYGLPVQGMAIKKTATPGELMVDARARQRLEAEMATGTLTPQSLDVAANVYLQTGQLPTGLGKAASGLRTQVMNRATELSTGKPAADVAGGIVEAKQDVAGRGQAVKAFSTGKQGQQVNAFNTAIDHLGTMDKLSDALQNGDVKAFNALGNTIARQTGQPAPTNFDAAKQIVTAEVIKAVVASGGGVTERQEAERNFAAANSPAQLKGLINTYQDLLGGQLKSLNLQYENTTGRKDFEKKLTPAAQSVMARVRGETPAAAAVTGANVVVTPDGQSHTFPTPAAAAQFKKAAGIP